MLCLDCAKCLVCKNLLVWAVMFWDGSPSTKHSNKGVDFSVPDSSLLQDNVAFVLCLDTLGRGNTLHLHVSKPPKEGTLQHAFLRELETVMKSTLGRWEVGTYCEELQLSRSAGKGLRGEERVCH